MNTRNRTRTVSALAALSAIALLSLGSQVQAELIFSENFNSYTGNQNNTQYQTGLKVAYGGNVSGWSKSGAGVMHAVDLANLAGQTNPSNWAIMFFQDNVITKTVGIAANDSGTSYEVNFDYGTAVYGAGNSDQRTQTGDGLLVEVLRADNTTLASGTYLPGAWDDPGNRNLAAGLKGTLSYTGDGTGVVRLRIGPTPPLTSGRFEGEIDNLSVSQVPEPGTLVLLGTGLLGLLAYAWRKRKSWI